MFYVQYNSTTGDINGTVSTSVAPVCENQLIFPEWVQTSGKKVDLATLTLVDAPVEEVQ